MRLVVNGDVVEVDDGSTVADLMRARAAEGRGSAVAVDGTVVPRAEWPARRLPPGAAVEIVTAVQGG